MTRTSSLGAHPGGAATTGCPVSCRRKDEVISTLYWSQLSITATITAETIMVVVNSRSNSTRTTTLTNPEVDLKDYTPGTDLNNAGTRTTSVVVTSGNAATTHTMSVIVG